MLAKVGKLTDARMLALKKSFSRIVGGSWLPFLLFPPPSPRNNLPLLSLLQHCKEGAGSYWVYSSHWSWKQKSVLPKRHAVGLFFGLGQILRREIERRLISSWVRCAHSKGNDSQVNMSLLEWIKRELSWLFCIYLIASMSCMSNTNLCTYGWSVLSLCETFEEKPVWTAKSRQKETSDLKYI